MKKKSILVVSPRGKPIKTISINFFTVSVVVIFLACGFGAYFIPSEKFRLKAAEQKQKQNLSSQNNMLYSKIHAALQMLNHLKEQINRLDEKKDRVTELTGVGASSASGASAVAHRRGNADYADMEPAMLLENVSRQEAVVSAFAAPADTGANPFDDIPVCKPVVENSFVSQRFGTSKDPFTERQKFHYGIDLAATPGTPVIATAVGIVTACEANSFWGKRIVIEHAKGLSTVYAHLGSVKVAKGKKVKRGQVIGSIGYSGLTTGPHVHYEIWRNGVALDPEAYFFPGSTELAAVAGK
jgi:murein DD-endopeptidase MepM/ murein hydrolase activator NlpD